MHQPCAHQPSFKARGRRISGVVFSKECQQENGFRLINVTFGSLAVCGARDDEPKACGTEQTSPGGFGFRELRRRSSRPPSAHGRGPGAAGLLQSPQQLLTLSTRTQMARLHQATCCPRPWSCAQTAGLRPQIRELHLSFPSHKAFFALSLLRQLAAVGILSPAERRQIKHQGFSIKRSQSRLFSQNSADFQLPAPEARC